MDDITQQTVEAINQAITAGEVIEAYTGQHPINNAYICPFHRDKRPSLTAKGKLWQCWACGAKGDIIRFVTEYHKIKFSDAVIKISKDFGITIPTLSGGQQEPESFEELGNRIVRECNRKNREQLKAALDQKIKDLNAKHRLRMRAGASDKELEYLANELDWLISEIDKI